jgi:hypothetical protein
MNTRPVFGDARQTLGHPATTRLLERLAEKTAGPRECCSDWATVIDCTDGVDTWECWCCGRTWTAPCR